jgi:uncharacterized protein
MRIFLDANILFSAAKSDGAIRQLLRLLLDARHVCVIDEFVLAETRRNLVAKYPKAISDFDSIALAIGVNPFASDANSTPEFVWLPEKDRPVLASAIRLRCDALLTGDRTHFGAGYGKVFGGVTIYSPRALAEAIAS